MDDYLYCTSESFKYDLNELCHKCPIRDLVQKRIEEYHIQMVRKKDILNDQHFLEWINNEIQSFDKNMNRVENLEKTNSKDGFKKKRIEIYIRNKEGIKYLNNVLLNLNEKESQDHQKIDSEKLFPFKTEKYYDLFFKFSQEIIRKKKLDKFKEYGYLFQRLLKDKQIYSIKHLDFMDWLKDKKLISEEDHLDFKIKKSFDSLQKGGLKREDKFDSFFR